MKSPDQNLYLFDFLSLMSASFACLNARKIVCIIPIHMGYGTPR